MKLHFQGASFIQLLLLTLMPLPTERMGIKTNCLHLYENSLSHFGDWNKCQHRWRGGRGGSITFSLILTFWRSRMTHTQKEGGHISLVSNLNIIIIHMRQWTRLTFDIFIKILHHHNSHSIKTTDRTTSSSGCSISVKKCATMWHQNACLVLGRAHGLG